MARKLGRLVQVKMGTRNQLRHDSLKEGELCFLTDEGVIVVGTNGQGNKEVVMGHTLPSVSVDDGTISYDKLDTTLKNKIDSFIKLNDIPLSSITKNGLMSSDDKLKLNSISAGATSTTIVNNLTSTSTTSGLSAYMGKELKAMIDNIGTSGGTGGGGSVAYELPTATTSVLGGVKIGANLAITNGTISVPQSSTIDIGVVKLNNTLTSTSTSEAATANAVKLLNDKISSSSIYAENVTKSATSNAFGKDTSATGLYSTAVGLEGTAFGLGSFSFGGFGANASGSNSIVSGMTSRANGSNSIAIGLSASALGAISQAFGYNAHANDYCSMAIGSFNHHSTGNSTNFSTTNNSFIVGNGNGSQSNAFRVRANGAVYGLSAFNSTGADYAEYFEWQDGNVHNEERVGLIVTLDGDKIRKAKLTDEYILGIISANPSVIGDSVQDQYHGMYEKDEFGRNKAVVKDVEVVKVDENGEEFTDIEQVTEFVINPNYNPEEEYIPREQRKEWDAVGLVGKLITRQDGTAQVNGYVKVSDSLDGIATHSDTRTEMRVMEVISDELIRVFIK